MMATAASDIGFGVELDRRFREAVRARLTLEDCGHPGNDLDISQIVARFGLAGENPDDAALDQARERVQDAIDAKRLSPVAHVSAEGRPRFWGSGVVSWIRAHNISYWISEGNVNRWCAEHQEEARELRSRCEQELREEFGAANKLSLIESLKQRRSDAAAAAASDAQERQRTIMVGYLAALQRFDSPTAKDIGAVEQVIDSLGFSLADVERDRATIERFQKFEGRLNDGRHEYDRPILTQKMIEVASRAPHLFDMLATPPALLSVEGR